MLIDYLLLLAALCITSVSGYISVVGLTSIFTLASSFYVIVAIAACLEVGKILATLWVHARWDVSNFLLKSYMIVLIIVLITLNAISSFGFLSKSYIEQTLHINHGGSEQIQILSAKIDDENQQIKDLDTQISQIDAAIDKMTQVGKATSSLKAAAAEKKTRDDLVKKKEDHVKNISTYNEERIKLNTGVKNLEAEAGPIRYLSQLVYGDSDNEHLEKAVRLFTILIVLIFDPLAVVMLIASNIGINSKKSLTKTTKHNILTLDDDIFEDKKEE